MKPLYLYEISYLLPRDGTLEPEDHDAPGSQYLKPLYKQVRTAKKLGKPYAYGREGGKPNRDREQLAAKISKRLGVKMTPFNLEDPETDIERNSSRSLKQLRRRHGRAGAEGIRHAMLAGQGNPRYRTKRGSRWLKKQGVDSNDKESMFRSAFPQDYDDEQGPIGRGTERINIMRRMGVRRRIQHMQKQGYHVGGVFGSGHFVDEK